MLKELDMTRLAARAVTGFFAGALGTYINRVLVRIVEVWPVFHFGSARPLVMLLSQDWPYMAKACLIFGLVYGIFCMCVPSHLVLATVVFMGVLVLAGRAYMIDGLQLANVYDDSLWILMHISIRAALILSVYWLLRALVVRRFAGEY
jgi:hypothetical protein